MGVCMRSLRVNMEIYMTFMELEKAYDRIDRASVDCLKVCIRWFMQGFLLTVLLRDLKVIA